MADLNYLLQLLEARGEDVAAQRALVEIPQYEKDVAEAQRKLDVVRDIAGKRYLPVPGEEPKLAAARRE